MVNFYWNLVYHTKLSTAFGWQDTRASPRLCCDPQFSFTCQHQRDVYNGKSLITSLIRSGLHARQIQVVGVKVRNEFPMWSNVLLISFFRHECANLKMMYAINVIVPYTWIFHTFVRVDHKWKVGRDENLYHVHYIMFISTWYTHKVKYFVSLQIPGGDEASCW